MLEKTMKINDIMNTIKTLSASQGFYGRLLAQLEDIKENDVERWELIKNELEAQNFTEPLDVVFYFEC